MLANEVEGYPIWCCEENWLVIEFHEYEFVSVYYETLLTVFIKLLSIESFHCVSSKEDCWLL